jgi:hypothetical protein
VVSLQASLDPPVGELNDLGFGLAYGDERVRGVTLFGVGALGLREVVGGGEFVVAGRCEAVAVARTPGGLLDRPACGDGAQVAAFGVGEIAVSPGVDRKVLRDAAGERGGEPLDRIAGAIVGRAISACGSSSWRVA